VQTSLDQLVEFLIHERGSESLYIRAIRLFEFQVALFYPKEYQKLLASTHDNRAPTTFLRGVRTYVASRFLDDIQAKLKPKYKSKPTPFGLLMKHPDYRKLFALFTANGGLLRMRRSHSEMSLDKQISKRRKRAEIAAKLIDFSYRFEPPQRGRWKCGITTAIFVVGNASSYGVNKKSKNSVQPFWKEFKSTSIFLYLLLSQDIRLMPPKISKKSFSKMLLSQAKDVVALRNFFRAYQHICEILAPKGYKSFEILGFNLKCGLPSLSRPPLDPDVIETFEKYKNEKSKPKPAPMPS